MIGDKRQLVVEMPPVTEAVAEGDVRADHPRVIEVIIHICDSASVFRMHREHLVEEGEESRRETLPHGWRLHRYTSLPLEKLVVVWVTECGLFPGKAASQHAEEKDSN